jgi:hypothetical protein
MNDTNYADAYYRQRVCREKAVVMLQLTIGKRIGIGVLGVLLQAIAVGCFGVWITARTSSNLEVVTSSYLPVGELATRVESEFLNARIHFIYFVTVQKPGALEKGWGRFRNAQNELPKLQRIITESDALTELRPEVEQLRRDFESYKPVLERIISVVQKNENHGPEFTALLNEWARLGGAMVDSAGRLSHAGRQQTADSATLAGTQLHRATVTLAGACLAALLTGVLLTYFITRGIGNELKEIAETLGDAARQVAASATQVSSAGQSLAQGASEQAASLEETSSASTQVNAMAGKNAANSKSAAENMVEASERVDQANRNLQQMVASMNEINDSSGKISKIIKVIDEIAFQTNILALNAAVEAARAGEAGMGFAVVADEVRNLSQRCAGAAQETAGLIEESIDKSKDGRAKLDQVIGAVRSITESATKVKTLVDEVEIGSKEQARGIDQVSKVIMQMETVTQATAAQAEESAAAGEELSGQAEALRDIVVRLEHMLGATS